MKKTGIFFLLIAAIIFTSACAAGEATTSSSTSTAAQSTAASENTTIPSDSTTATPGVTIPSDTGAEIPEAPEATEGTVPSVDETFPDYGVPAPTEPTEPPVKENDTFAFKAYISGSDVVNKGDAFCVEVETTNISGTIYTYRGSSVIVGAMITLTLEENGQIITLMPDAIIQPRDISLKDIAPGETITNTWTFSDFSGAVEGTYDLHFSFQGYEGMIEDFVTLQ